MSQVFVTSHGVLTHSFLAWSVPNVTLQDASVRRLRYALNLSDAQLVKIFALADYELSQDDARALLGKEDEEGGEEEKEETERKRVEGKRKPNY